MGSQYDQNSNTKMILSTISAPPDSPGNNYEYRIGGRSEKWNKYDKFELFSFKGYVCLKIKPKFDAFQIIAIIKSYSDTKDIKSTRTYSSSIGLNVPGNTFKRPGRIDFLASERAYNFLEQLGEMNWNDINDIKTYSISIGKNTELYKQVLDALNTIPKLITKGGKGKNTKKRSLVKKKSLKAIRLKRNKNRSKKRHIRKVKKTKRNK